jgi:hypothetical protein
MEEAPFFNIIEANVKQYIASRTSKTSFNIYGYHQDPIFFRGWLDKRLWENQAMTGEVIRGLYYFSELRGYHIIVYVPSEREDTLILTLPKRDFKVVQDVAPEESTIESVLEAI